MKNFQYFLPNLNIFDEIFLASRMFWVKIGFISESRKLRQRLRKQLIVKLVLALLYIFIFHIKKEKLDRAELFSLVYNLYHTSLNLQVAYFLDFTFFYPIFFMCFVMANINMIPDKKPLIPHNHARFTCQVMLRSKSD